MPEYKKFKDRSVIEKAGAMAKGGLLGAKYFGSEDYLRHIFHQDRIVEALANRINEPRVSGGLLDSAINFAGAYDWGVRPGVDPQDARDMGLAYQMFDATLRDFGRRIPEEEELDYIQNMAGVEAGIMDREQGRRMTDLELLDAAIRYAKNYGNTRR